MTTPHEALAYALALAGRGMAVFPCNAKKRPSWPKSKGGNGFYDATTDADRIRDIWKAWPGTLVGVRTGEASDLSVLDLDLQHIAASEWFVDHADRLSSYRANQTRSGGLHILFRHTQGDRNSAGRIAQNVDVRGEGGYIIWWPANGFSEINADVDPVPFPAWLLRKIRKPKAPIRELQMAGAPSPSEASDMYVGSALMSAYKNVALAGEGQRNDTLNREAYALARFVSAGSLPESVLFSSLKEAAQSAGLEDGEIEATLYSALRGRLANGR